MLQYHAPQLQFNSSRQTDNGVRTLKAEPATAFCHYVIIFLLWYPSKPAEAAAPVSGDLSFV